MPRARVKLLSPGMQELLNDDGVRRHLNGLAEQVLAEARASAPVRTGAYRNSLHLEQATTDRAVVRVVADVDHALAVESATGTLTRALSAV